MNDVSQIAQNLISLANAKNIYLVLRLQDYKSKRFVIKNGQIDRTEFNRVKGIGIHAFTKSGHTGFASLDTISANERLFKCLETAINAARTAKEEKFETIKDIFKLKPLKGKIVQKVENNAFDVSNRTIQKDLFTIHNKLRRENQRLSVANAAGFSQDHRRVFRTDGTDLESTVSRSFFSTLINISQKDNLNELYTGHAGLGYEILSKKHQVEFHRKMLSNTLQHIKTYDKAISLRPGNYPLLLDGKVTGTFIHEAFGHSAEADHTYQKSPLLKNGKIKKGEKVAGSYVTIVDHATKKDFGFNPFSCYGVKRQKTLIVRNGRINNLISDVITARKTNSTLTGGERSDFYSSIPIPRMSGMRVSLDKKHTIQLPYNHLTADIKIIHATLKKHKVFKKFPEIIYLMGSGGGQVNSFEGNFQFGSKVSFKLTLNSIDQLKPVSFSGKTLEALRSVQLAFGDPVNSPGLCGKFDQYVPVSEKCPMLLLSSNKYVTVG